MATAAAAVTGRCGSCAAAICARWLRRLGAQRPRCLRGTADSVGAIGGSIAPRRAGRPRAREGSSNRGSRKFAGNRRERGCERPEGVGVVAGGALNGTWRPQGGRAASPRPRGTQAALSRHPAGAKKVIFTGFARERLISSEMGGKKLGSRCKTGRQTGDQNHGAIILGAGRSRVTCLTGPNAHASLAGAGKRASHFLGRCSGFFSGSNFAL